MENFARRLYHWLPLSIKQKTALRKFVSIHLGWFVFGWRKTSYSSKDYFFGHRIDSMNIEQLKVLIVSEYKLIYKKAPATQAPTVSIIIPVYNHVDFTVRCLLSIAKANPAVQYEIIVADDASSDETSSIFGDIEFIHYLRNENNNGFLKTCNWAAHHASGKYLLFLNNDTVVQDGWLDSLLQTFVDFSDAGLVGSKFIYPDGRLQEAGGIIWKDGTGRNYGWGGDPKRPEYNYLREVDYCSGASIMIPSELWRQLGGFDEMFAPAYYEDTDLAFRVRNLGYKVYYQPASEVIHFEGLSSGADIDVGVKKYQEINRHKFVQKWRSVLAQHGDRISGDEYSSRNRYTTKRILYIDSSTPAPDRDSGSIDAFQYLYSLRKLGYEVSFIPASNLNFMHPYTRELQCKGTECLYFPYLKNVDAFIKQQGKYFDIVFLSRFTIASQYYETIVKYMPHAKIVFNTVDLHFLRAERAAKTKGSEKELVEVQDIKQRELEIIQKVDNTIVVSEREKEILQDLLPDAPVSVIPIPRIVYGSSREYESRRDIVFIGGYKHSPNVDAVSYFVKEIWPLIHKRLRDARFLIAGSNMPTEFSRFASESVILRGYVDDLGVLFDQCRLSVAPLRFGSGVKGKIVTSLSYGVPCVATSIALEGMGLVAGQHVLQADSPKEYADAVVEVYSNANLWRELSNNGLAIVEERYSPDVTERKINDLLKGLR